MTLLPRIPVGSLFFGCHISSMSLSYLVVFGADSGSSILGAGALGRDSWGRNTWLEVKRKIVPEITIARRSGSSRDSSKSSLGDVRYLNPDIPSL